MQVQLIYVIHQVLKQSDEQKILFLKVKFDEEHNIKG